MAADETLIQTARTYREQGLLAEARTLLESCDPLGNCQFEALCLLGEICGQQADHAAAATYLSAANELQPDRLETLFFLGVALQNRGNLPEALACFQRIRNRHPELPLPLRWLGLIYTELGNDREALDSYREALRLDPHYEEALIGLATLQIKRFQLEEAEGLLDRALQINPANASALNELSRIYRLQGRAAESLALLRTALKFSPESCMLASNLLYGLCNLDTLTPEETAEEHMRLAGRLYPLQLGFPQPVDWPAHDDTIRVGYLSGDFYTHSVAAFIEPILMHHDRRTFQPFCYSNRNIPDETTRRLQSLPVVWRDIYGQSAESVAETIRNDRIHILVDLSGHTAGNRLDVCALKPAPVLVSWIGYPHTSGLPQVDYYLSDAHCDPPGRTEQLYRERLWRLPQVFSCYLPPMEFPAVVPPPYHRNGTITFGCFNNFSKVTETMLSLWAKILHQVPGSHLCLKSLALGDSATRARIAESFRREGIETGRIIIHGYTPSAAEHLALYGSVDIALDTYPYHGTTTTCEALWMGVPVVTLAGRSHIARVGVSFLTAVGIEELIAISADEYVEMAVELARDRERIERYRADLRGAMARSALMDGAAVTRDVENAFRAMLTEKLADMPEKP